MNNKKLINLLSKLPKIYETNNTAFWDDKHISGSMLKNHLEPDTDGASRKHNFIERSVQWISKLAKEPGRKKLLDLGCGPGIYAEMLHNKGFDVTGIDFSKRSIAYAKNSAKRKKLDIEYIYKDYLKINYKKAFDTVLLIYCDFGVLAPQDGKKLLKKIYDSLRPGGMFIMDAFTAQQYIDFKEGLITSYEDKGFWRPDKYACIQNNKAYKKQNTYLEQYIIISEKELQHYNLWNRSFSKDELSKLLRAAGFTNMSFFEDVTGKALNPSAKTICASAIKS